MEKWKNGKEEREMGRYKQADEERKKEDIKVLVANITFPILVVCVKI